MGLTLALLLATLAPGTARVAMAQADAPESGLRASTTRDGVRLTTKLDGPLVAGEPAIVRSRLTNVGDEPIWWLVSSGIGVRAEMPDARWRTGNPPTVDFKNAVVRECEPSCDRVHLSFDVKRANGRLVDHWGSDMLVTQRLEPGASVTFVREWDGDARLDDQPSSVGLPPGGPVRIESSAAFSRSSNGEGRALRTRIETSIEDGRPDAHLHPLEAVDAALEDATFAAAMADEDFGHANAVVMWDPTTEAWYVGSCALSESEDEWHARLAAVDPVSGAVLDHVDAATAEPCTVEAIGDSAARARPESGPS